jgi:FAD/FMN-containing dehydrogenase
VTTGGGTGVLTGQYGHIVDNLLCARVALADGTIVTASPESNSDLFWAIRGGGSNFGICTEFTYKAHYQGPVVL